jgi:hypothetical protein
MKRILSFFAITAVVTVVIVACNSSSGMKVNATELAEFNAWKAENEKSVVQKESVSRKVVNYQSPKMVSESQNPAKTPEKKGWSKAAKGAVIGAGSGAILGAVINKRNRAVDAVVGGVLGGGAGYGIGRSIDKKDGRS